MKDLETMHRKRRTRGTNARLNAVEGIKQTVDGEHCRLRRAVIIALTAGLVLAAMLLLYPLQAPEMDYSCSASSQSVL